jgi:hypothetical protein
MNSLDKQARAELVENLRNVYLKGEGVSGGKGTKKGAKNNPYIQYLKEYKGIKNPNMSYKEHQDKYYLLKKGKGVSGGAGTKKGAKNNNYIQYLRRYKGMKDRPPYDKNIDYTKPVMPKAPRPSKAVRERLMKRSTMAKRATKKVKKSLPSKLVMFNKCLQRYRRDNPDVPYREAQKIVKRNINYKTGQCKGIPRVEYDMPVGTLDPAKIGMGGVLDDYGGVLDDYGGVLDDYGGVLDDYGGVLDDYGGMLH